MMMMMTTMKEGDSNSPDGCVPVDAVRRRRPTVAGYERLEVLEHELDGRRQVDLNCVARIGNDREAHQIRVDHKPVVVCAV